MALTCKSVVVTGGSRGIGKGLVEKLLSRQNKVIATTRNPQDASQLQQLAAQHSNLTITQLDTSQPQSIKDWAASLKQHTSHVDVLINNAGMYGRRLQLAEFEAEDFMTVFQTNAVGPFLVVQQLLKQGLLGPPGSLVVNVSSIMASHGDETVSGITPGGYAYRASKAALNMLVVTSVQELTAKNITSVMLHPGYVATDMTAGQPGTIPAAESVAGQLKLLQDGRPLNGKFYSYTGEELAF